MSFDYTTLITDRTQGDVSRVEELARKIKANTASEAELAEWNGAAMRGAYNYTDLNRVTEAMEDLRDQLDGFGYLVPGYEAVLVPHRVPAYSADVDEEGYLVIDHWDEWEDTVWLEWDIPTPALMNKYLANVAAIRGVINMLPDTPQTPADMELFSWMEANDIERILVDLNILIEQMVRSFSRSDAFTFWSGNRPLPSAESYLGRNWEELDAMETAWTNWQVADWYLLLYGNLEAEGEVD